MHQLGEGQWVGGGPAAAAHRLQRETKQVRGALLAGLSAVREQLTSQRERRGHLEVKQITRSSVRLRPAPNQKGNTGEHTVIQPNISISSGKLSLEQFSAE